MDDPTFVVGVNGGATHTTTVLIDSQLTELRRVEGGPTNHRNIGLEAACQILAQTITQAAQPVGLAKVSAISVALAGTDHPGDQALFRQYLETAFPGKKISVENDAVAALVGGAEQRFGIVTISGTGSICVGVNAQGQQMRTGGQGYFVDRGSGYAIARETLLAICRAEDNTGPATRLSERVLTRVGLSTIYDLIDWLYEPKRLINEIAALAQETIALAEEDVVASGIIYRAADGLAENAISLGRRLGFDQPDSPPFPLILSGGVFDHCALLCDLYVTLVRTALPAATVIPVRHDAAIGSAIIALNSLGIAGPVSPLADPATLLRASEQRNRLTMNLSQRSALDFAALMNLEDVRVALAITPQLPHIAALIEAAADRFEAGGRLLLVGAGTSGRLAEIDAIECVPTFGTTPDQVVGVFAGGSSALTRSVEQAEDDEAAGHAAIAELNAGALDTVIGIAASGGTPFVQGALREATARGCLTGSIVNVYRAPISELTQHPIIVVTGPEVLTGSTRLKAGTAQKLVLNMISTGVMVRVGRTFGNLMINVQASNAKLRERANRIVAQATGLELTAAAELLTSANGEIPTAIAAAFIGTTPDEARQRLAAVNGNLNRLAPHA